MIIGDIDKIVQKKCNSSLLAMELYFFCTNLWIPCLSIIPEDLYCKNWFVMMLKCAELKPVA